MHYFLVVPNPEDMNETENSEGKIVDTKSVVDPESLFEDADEHMAMQALDGFLVVLSTDGDIIYVSENINDYIGIQQVNC